MKIKILDNNPFEQIFYGIGNLTIFAIVFVHISDIVCVMRKYIGLRSDRKLRRQPENLFLISLAVSDLFVSVLVMIFAAANDLLGYWPFGENLCKLWICLDIICSTASILNLCAIAFDRYLHISRPMKYARYCSKNVIIMSIVLVWGLSTLIGFAEIICATMIPDTSSQTTDFVNTISLVATNNYTSSSYQCELKLQPIYAVVSSTLSFFLPATIMILLYTKLYLYARMHVRSIRAQLKQATSLLIMQLASDRIRQVVVRPCIIAHHTALHYGDIQCQPDETSTFDTCPPTINNNSYVTVTATTTINEHCDSSISTVPTTAIVASTIRAKDHNSNNKYYDSKDEVKRSSTNSNKSVSDQKARLTLGVIMGTFLICWLPFFVINVFRSFYPHFFSQRIVTWLGYANSTANPVIYGIFNRDFRRAFSKIVFKIFYCFEMNSKRKFANFSDCKM